MKTTKSVIEKVLNEGQCVTYKYRYFRFINAIYRMPKDAGDFHPWDLVKVLWKYE